MLKWLLYWNNEIFCNHTRHTNALLDGVSFGLIQSVAKGYPFEPVIWPAHFAPSNCLVWFLLTLYLFVKYPIILREQWTWMHGAEPDIHHWFVTIIFSRILLVQLSYLCVNIIRLGSFIFFFWQNPCWQWVVYTR